jgi:hypothetical protein
MAKSFKKFSTAKAHSNGLPIVKIDDLYIVIESDLMGASLTSVELIDQATGSYNATVTLFHLSRLGNANHASPRAGSHYGSGKNLFADRDQAIATLAPAPIAAAELEAVDELVADAMNEPAQLCYVAAPSAKVGERIRVIFRGEAGYHVADFDQAAIPAGEIEQLVADLNADLGVDRIEARAMVCGSMFGWNVPAADSRHVRDALAEADAIATAHGVQ